MAYDIGVEWAAWRATPAQGADPITVCTELAAMLTACLNSTGDTPIGKAWGYAVQQPTTPWPNLIVLPSPQPADARTLDSCSRAHEYHLLVNFLFGPANGDVATMEATGALYKDAVDMAISANPTLAGLVHGLRLTHFLWGDLQYAGGAWYTLQCRVDALVAYTRRPQYVNDF